MVGPVAIHLSPQEHMRIPSPPIRAGLASVLLAITQTLSGQSPTAATRLARLEGWAKGPSRQG